MAIPVTLAEGANTDGLPMTLDYQPTCSWQAFSIQGLPAHLATWEGKGLSLAKAVEIWNASVECRKNALQVATISARIRAQLDTARDAQRSAMLARPLPNF